MVVTEYLRTGSLAEAAKAIQANNSKSAVYQRTRNIIKKELDIGTILSKYGVTPDFIVKKLKETMDANNKNGDAEWGARLKGIELAAKMKGYFKQQVDVTSAGRAVPLLGGGSITYVQNNYGSQENNGPKKEDKVR